MADFRVSGKGVQRGLKKKGLWRLRAAPQIGGQLGRQRKHDAQDQFFETLLGRKHEPMLDGRRGLMLKANMDYLGRQSCC